MLHKSNVCKAQLATNWPYSSHFHAQFTSRRKQAKWNVGSEHNQMQTKNFDLCIELSTVSRHDSDWVTCSTHWKQNVQIWLLLDVYSSNSQMNIPHWPHDGFSNHIRFQLEVSSGGVINVPPRRNHDTAITHNSGYLSSKVMMHSCRVGPFSDVLWMCWLKRFRQRLWEKYKSNQVSQTLHVKKWLHFKRCIFVRSVSDIGVISLTPQHLKQYIQNFLWAPEINHHQVLCYNAQVIYIYKTLFSRVLHYSSSLFTTNLTGNSKTIFTDMGVSLHHDWINEWEKCRPGQVCNYMHARAFQGRGNDAARLRCLAESSRQ